MKLAGVICFFITLILVHISVQHPVILFNVSDSMEPGFYMRTTSSDLKTGDIIIIKMTKRKRIFSYNDGYVKENNYYMKRIVGMRGDEICRNGKDLTLNNQYIGKLLDITNKPNLSPNWNKCHVLDEGEYFLFSEKKNSFDSRYFGWVERNEIDGVVKKINF